MPNLNQVLNPSAMMGLNALTTMWLALEASGMTTVLAGKYHWAAVVIAGLNTAAHALSPPTPGPLNTGART